MGGLPPVDSVDVWPMISGRNLTSPRETILVTNKLLVHKQWKYVAGGAKMIESAWGGPVYPNASTPNDSIDGHQFQYPKQGCLFDVVADRSERHEVSAKYPQVVQSLQALMDEQRKTIWSTSHITIPHAPKPRTDDTEGFTVLGKKFDLRFCFFPNDVSTNS